MIGLKVKEAKGQFFNRVKVEKAVDRGRIQALSRIGAMIRQAARGLMRKGKKSAKPGQPPRVWAGLVKRFLFFVYDPSTRSTVVGPAVLDGRKGEPVPGLLEGGGRVTRKGRDGKSRTDIYEGNPFMGPALRKREKDIPRQFINRVKEG